MTIRSVKAPEYVASFYIWETVTWPILLTEEGTDASVLEGYKHIVVSLAQGNVHVDFMDPPADVSTGVVTIRLEQEQAGRFKPGVVELQVNIYYEDTERDTSTKGFIEALDNLYKKVID